MNWIEDHGLAKRLNKLPLVIAGPMLRRVEAHTVSVWIALKENAGPLRLHLYDLGSQTPKFSSSEVTQSNLVQLGDRLFVSLLTASVPTDSTDKLVPGNTYEYDIVFGDAWVGAKLDAIGVLNNPEIAQGGIQFITYPGGPSRPSFSLPPSNINDLRVAHSSCRKPHGGNSDASLAHDWMIFQSINQPNNRLHQLYLTGDQIYSDDVADALLYMINDAESIIIGWNEELPLVQPTDDLAPGNRAKIIGEKAELSVGEEPASAKSHLIKLSEYYLMYLFAWSPVLWPDQQTNLPVWSDLFPGRETHVIKSPTTKDAIVSPPVPKDVYTTFQAELTQVNVFRDATISMRRLLANVPSYMMYDDHEVTDDWFIDLDWCKTTLNNALAKRIMQNAVSAFAVMQAWGNVPDHPEFIIDSSNNPSLLTLLRNISINSSNNSSFNIIGSKVVPTLSPIVNMYNQDGYKLEGTVDFSFSIDFGYFKTIAIDSRARRFFPATKEAPALLSSDDLTSQITQNITGLTSIVEFVLILAPAPIIGHAVWEEAIQPFLATKIKVHGSRIVDVETWKSHHYFFEELLRTLNFNKRVVIISGDIHFSFTADGKYWNRRENNPLNISSFAQLTCSAAKNSTEKTVFISTLGSSKALGAFDHFANGLADGLANIYVNGIEENSPFHNRMIQVHKDLRWYNKFSDFRSPETIQYRSLGANDLRLTNGLIPSWSYRISFLNDNRDKVESGVFTAAQAVDPYMPPSTPLLREAYIHQREAGFNPYSIAVGTDVVGEVTFSLTGTNLEVTHALWYTLKAVPPFTGSDYYPFVVHRCNLDPFNQENEPTP